MVRRTSVAALGIAIGVAFSAPPGAAHAATPEAPGSGGVARLVLVVGNNQPLGPEQETLRYADDDAVRYFERFEGLADTRIVLTRFDERSRIYRDVYPDLPPPTREAFARAVGRIHARAAALRAEGRFVELVFVFAGHGGLQDGGHYLALEDGPLTRATLEASFLARAPVDLVHFVIDACNAAGVVESRGPLAGRRAPMPPQDDSFAALAARYPRAGFVLASAAGGAAFEWSRFGSGVASHLIRSGLSGAADASPPDGRVTYDELGAYLHAATSGLLPEEFQQDIRVLAPRALPSAALVDLRAPEAGAALHVDRPGRYYVRDADGHRILDFHHGRGELRLWLPPYSPRFALLRVDHHGPGCAAPGRLQRGCVRDEVAYEIEPAAGALRLSGLASSQTTVATRGVIEDSVFEQLLTTPFEGVSLEGAAEAETQAEDATPPTSVSLGYRATLGAMQRELSVVHGIDLRLDLPLGEWMVLSPVIGFGRGRAHPDGAPDYLVYQLDLGVDVGARLLRGRLAAVVGVEARYQVLDQFPPGEGDRFASLALGGPSVHLRYDVLPRFALGASFSGGARLGLVEEETRVRPYAGLGVTVLGDF